MRKICFNIKTTIKEIFRYPTPKLAFFFGILIGVMSCKTWKPHTDNYNVINTVLDHYVDKDSIYLYPKIIELSDEKLEEIKRYGIDKDTCNIAINAIILNGDKSKRTKNNTKEKWNYAKIKNPKVITRLQLKQPYSIEKYKKLIDSIKDEDDLLDRKFMLWTFEHNESMIRLSRPFLNKDRSYALVYISEYNNGEFVLTLKKEGKKRWNIICKKRLSHY